MGQIFVNGTQYAGILSDAQNIRYSGSGLSATTVQAALNELANKKIQADWSISDSTQNGYILNKPVIKSGSRSGSIMIGNNYVDDGTNLLAIGAGAATAANIAEVNTAGQGWFKGGLYIGGTSSIDASRVATEQWVVDRYIPLSGSDVLTGDLIPVSPSTYNLGTSAQTWGNIYGDVLNAVTVQTENGYINTLTSINSISTPVIQLAEKATISYDNNAERIVFSFN